MIKALPIIIPETEDAYIVGGSVRDLFLGHPPTDVDIAVFTDPGKFADKLASGNEGRVVHIGKTGKTITRVILKDMTVDIVPGDGSSIQDDLRKRDFTINAMACHLSTGEVIDDVSGINDLKNKTIRMVSEDALINDPARMVRAFRLAASLGFEIEPLTLSAIMDNAARIHHTAGERIRLELLKILGTSASFRYISKMADARLLFHIIPELTDLKKCRQNRFHQYDVFDHTMKAYQCLEILLNKDNGWMSGHGTFLDSFTHTGRVALLKFAILLHDIGKPAAKTIDEKSRVKFHGHESIGADMATAICKRLRFSNHEAAYVDFVIRNHLRPLSLFILHQKNALKRKSIIRFFMKCKEKTPDILLHAMADFKGKKSETSEKNVQLETFAKDIVHLFFTDFTLKTKKPPLITGDDLTNELNLTPSPIYKSILNKAEEARISNEINTKEEALDLAKTLLKNIE